MSPPRVPPCRAHRTAVEARRAPGSRRRPGARLDRATERGGPLPHSRQPVAAASGVAAGGGSFVVDTEPDAAGPVADPDPRGTRSGVPDHVGQRLLHDTEGGEVRAGRHGRPFALGLDGDGQSGARRLFDEFGEPVESGGRGPGGVSGGAQGVEHLTHLAQRLLAGRLDGGQRRTRLLRIGVQQRESHARLDVDDGDAVGQDVMEFARHPQPFLIGPALLRRLPFRLPVRPLLTAYAYELGGGDDGHHPGGDAQFLSPGGGMVVRGRQPPVEPVRHQDVPQPHHADGGPGGPPVPRDHGAEAAHGDGQEDRPVRIAGHQIDHRCGRAAEDGHHGVAVAHQEHGHGQEEQQPREEVQRGPLVHLPPGRDGRADHDDGTDQDRRRPGQPGGGPPRRPGQPPRRLAVRPGGPPPLPCERCSSMPATLDRGPRPGRQPGVVLTRTPRGVRRTGEPSAVPADGQADRAGHLGDRFPEEDVPGLHHPVELAEDLEGDQPEQLRPGGDQRGGGLRGRPGANSVTIRAASSRRSSASVGRASPSARWASATTAIRTRPTREAGPIVACGAV